MGVAEILNRCERVGDSLLLDVDKLTEAEIKILESAGYKVRLYNQTWIKKPYYQIV